MLNSFAFSFPRIFVRILTGNTCRFFLAELSQEGNIPVNVFLIRPITSTKHAKLNIRFL